MGEIDELNLNDITLIDFDRSVIGSANWDFVIVFVFDNAEVIVGVGVLDLVNLNDFGINRECIFVFQVKQSFTIEFISKICTLKICTLAPG